MLSICAVIAVRNEAPYLRVLLPMLAAQHIEVAILDNASTDGGRDICQEHFGNPVVMVKDLPYHGYFSLTEQLLAKQQLYSILKHDWVIHHDADEVFEHLSPGKTLRDAIEEADQGGYNALNFDEFVFLPEPAQDYLDTNYYRGLLRYYFFEPHGNRKNSTWKRTAALSAAATGGHTFSGDHVRIWPKNHVFRHYIVLSYEHAKDKYLTRSFGARDIARGWHGNRLHFTAENLRLPADAPGLFRLDWYGARDFRRDAPSLTHYWEWTSARVPW
jgi:glycosyltransferase involved in cell wall biosynthesis